MPLIMVLNDGETWTMIEGCSVYQVKTTELVNAMQESRTPEGTLKFEFTNDGLIRVHNGVVAVASKL